MSCKTKNFGMLYHPTSALVFYQKGKDQATAYVEYFDMDSKGLPINAHPLTIREANRLAKSLKTGKEKKEPCLKPEGIVGSNILSIDAMAGKVVWFTKTMQRNLYFKDSLDIPKGGANVPPMLWIASRDKLFVFALYSNRRPTLNTQLYHAPFFNVYEDGNVCLGSVDVSIKRTASLEEFIKSWEGYFFNSYFSHLNEHNPVNGNCVSLWKDLITTGQPFPMEILKKSNQTLKEILL